MLTWLLANLALGLISLAFIVLHPRAPHRLRFHAGFAALAAWLVPWPLLARWLPDLRADAFDMGLWRLERAVEAGSAQLTGMPPVIVVIGDAMPARSIVVVSVVELAFVALTVVGAMLFAWKLVAHRRLLRRLAQKGGDGAWLWTRANLAPACPVTVQREISGAFSSGVFRPRIWVHGDLVQSPQLATLLRHELTHIRQHDNAWLFVITLVECLFWWNPLVWYLGRRTRELQELSCDEACQHAQPDYPEQLAQLMHASARGGQSLRAFALGANIFSKPNPNVKRIQLLIERRSYPMSTRHMFGAAAAALTAVFTVGFVAAQPGGAAAVPGQRVEVFRLQRAPGVQVEEDVMIFADDRADLPPGAPRMTRGIVMGGAGDQFVKIDMMDSENISFAFHDAPLRAVLIPLAGILADPGAPPPLGIGGRPLQPGDADAQGVGMPPQVLTHVRRIDGAPEGLAEDMPGAPRVFLAQGGGEAGTIARAVPALHDRVVFEYPDAADRLVTVSANDVTLRDALELIAAASGCNIFRDGDTIVVDYCD